MKLSGFFITCTAFFLAGTSLAFPLGKKDGSAEQEQNSNQQKSENQNDFLKIDMILNTKSSNQKNSLKWKTSSASYDDYFDTVSGASKVHSTKYLRESTLDSVTKAFKIPNGLRALCLFAVANPEMLSKDNFLVSKEGKKLTINFTHRKIDYKIESDEEGIIHVPEGFFMKSPEKNSENTKSEDTKSEKKEDSKTPPSAPEAASDFKADIPPESISAIYVGKLQALLSPEGILSVNGKLNLEKYEKPQIKEEPKEELPPAQTDKTAD